MLYGIHIAMSASSKYLKTNQFFKSLKTTQGQQKNPIKGQTITNPWGMDFVSSSPLFLYYPPFFKIFK
jgi:hypothetical protein